MQPLSTLFVASGAFSVPVGPSACWFHGCEKSQVCRLKNHGVMDCLIDSPSPWALTPGTEGEEGPCPQGRSCSKHSGPRFTVSYVWAILTTGPGKDSSASLGSRGALDSSGWESEVLPNVPGYPAPHYVLIRLPLLPKKLRL